MVIPRYWNIDAAKTLVCDVLLQGEIPQDPALLAMHEVWPQMPHPWVEELAKAPRLVVADGLDVMAGEAATLHVHWNWTADVFGKEAGRSFHKTGDAAGLSRRVFVCDDQGSVAPDGRVLVHDIGEMGLEELVEEATGQGEGQECRCAGNGLKRT